MENYIATAIYQNKRGEMCALVEDYSAGECIYRFIENIERIDYSAEDIAEEAERGFDGFDAFDPYDYGGYSFGEVAFNLTENEDYKLIAEFCDNVSHFDTECMDERARALFAPLMKTSYRKGVCDIHEEQICFFAA